MSESNTQAENQGLKQLLLDRRMLICVGTGFASGLPLLILFQLVPAWMRLDGVSLAAIGFFNIVNILYILKFLWAPFLDFYRLPFLGLRRGWLILTQIGLVIFIAALGHWRPSEDFSLVLGLSLVVAFFGASQDILLDAYRREILFSDGELALGNTVHIQAYRVAGLVPGSLGLILADIVPWTTNFAVMAGFMALGIVLTLIIREPDQPAGKPTDLKRAITEPFQEFFRRKTLAPALGMLAFLVLYKLGDNLAVALLQPFYLDLGFTPTQIGLVAKNAALWSAIAGGIVGAIIIVRIGINKGLWIFGFVQLITILGFAWLSETGPDLIVLAIVIAGENIGVGLGTAASVAFIARETSHLAVATQFALFSAIAAMPRLIASMVSGVLVESMGWTQFFLFSTCVAVPGMILLYWVAPWNAPLPGDKPEETLAQR
ncbi:MAG: AmpG family muropeptide MFS transporter [Pseudomonadota bacterium]